MLSLGFGPEAEPHGGLNEREQGRRLRHIANYGIRESQVKIVIPFLSPGKMGSVEAKGTFQEPLFKAQEMTLDEMETPSCRAPSGANAPERVRRETSTPVLFMTEAQLKKLDDAVRVCRNDWASYG